MNRKWSVISLLHLISLTCLFSSSFATVNFIGMPGPCLQNWITFELIPKTSLATTTSLCLTQAFTSQCRGVRCSNGLCHAISSLNDTNICLGHAKNLSSQIYLKNVTVTTKKDIVMVVPEQGELKSISVSGSLSLPMPSLIGPQNLVEFRNGILACEEAGVSCRFWAQDSPSWKSFPSTNYIHETGALHVLNGKPVMLAGAETNIVSIDIVEIYDAILNTWSLGPPLTYARRQFGSLVVNDISLIVVAGYSDQFGYLRSVEMLNVEDMVWLHLPDYPIYVFSIACGHVEFEQRDHILCSGGTDWYYRQAFTLDLSRTNSDWEWRQKLDTPEGFARGTIVQWEHYLYYLTKQCHIPIPWMLCNRVYKLDLDLEDPEWVDLKLFPTHDFYNSTTFTFVTRYTIQEL